MLTVSRIIRDLDENGLRALRSRLAARGLDLDQLLRQERARYGPYHDLAERGFCPQCAETHHRQVRTRVTTARDAERRGWLAISREARPCIEAEQTLYVVCPECGWQAFPSADEFEDGASVGTPRADRVSNGN